MLGVAPSQNLTPTPREPTDDVGPNPPQGYFEPFAPVPGTLTGLNPSNSAPGGEEAEPEEGGIEPAPRTLAGLAAPSHTPQLHPGRTLMGFGAIPNAASDAAATAAAAAVTGTAKSESNAGADSAGAAPRPESAKGQLRGTLLGVAPNVAAPFGEPPNTAASAATTGSAADPAFRGSNPAHHATILGVAPLPSQLVESPSQNATPAHHATILGVAPLPSQLVESPSHNAAPSPGAEGPVAAAHRVEPVHRGTLLGVAMPGIAPLQPGQAKSDVPLTPAAPLQVSQRPQPHDAPSHHYDARVAADRPHDQRTVQRRRLAWVFGTAAVLLVLLIVVALGVWWTSVHLAVAVTAGETGNERLVLSCSNCPDGTKATIDSKTTTFAKQHATLELARRLSIGDNRLTLEVVRPGRTRGETVSVVVPVEFRVTSSVVDLVAAPPTISVQYEAAPGSRIVVDGQTHAVGTSGQLKVPIDVSSVLTGQASAVLPFERSIAYEVILEGHSAKGTVVVRTGITPLEVTSPNSMHVTQHATFTLSGRTSAKAKLSANGHNISVAADGTFHQEMALSAPGATKLYLRVAEANLAPRLLEIELERVTNLKQRADELARALTTDFDEIAALAITKPYGLVALRAEVVDVESAGALTRLVVTASCKQQPCLASIRYAGTLQVHRGSHIMTVGKAHLTQRPNSSEQNLLIDAALVVEEPER